MLESRKSNLTLSLKLLVFINEAWYTLWLGVIAGDVITCILLLKINNEGGKSKALYSEDLSGRTGKPSLNGLLSLLDCPCLSHKHATITYDYATACLESRISLSLFMACRVQVE